MTRIAISAMMTVLMTMLINFVQYIYIFLDENRPKMKTYQRILKKIDHILENKGNFTDEKLLEEALSIVDSDGKTLVSKAIPRYAELMKRFEELLGQE